MRVLPREHGRFVSRFGLRKVISPPGGQYALIIVDSSGRPVSPLTEWYRLRKQPGPDGTRRTYLGFLLPFFGYLCRLKQFFSSLKNIFSMYQRTANAEHARFEP